MSTLTSNLKLVKPTLGDAADITAMNPNWDTLDIKIKELIDAGWTKDEIIAVINENITDTDISGKVNKSGDELTGALNFKNLNEFKAISKVRTISGRNYYINWGCGQLGGEGTITMELYLPSTTGEQDTVLGKLEIGSHGVSFVDGNKRTYLYTAGLTSASVEN